MAAKSVFYVAIRVQLCVIYGSRVELWCVCVLGDIGVLVHVGVVMALRIVDALQWWGEGGGGSAACMVSGGFGAA